MFSLFRRRGRSSKEEKQAKNVAKPDEIAAKLSGEEELISPPPPIVESLENGARASDSKVNLDSTEKPQKSFVNYHQYGDGCVVVSETSTASQNEGADLQGRPSDNDNHNHNHDDLSRDQRKKEKPAKQPKTKSQTSNRRSIFFRHFQSPTPSSSESRYQQLDEDQLNDTVATETQPQPQLPATESIEIPNKPSKKFNPIEKGRELFNEILMAKGRHRNNRHQHKGVGCGIVGGGGQGSKTSIHQDLKKPTEVFDLTSQNIPEPTAGQHTYQISKRSKNTQDQRTTDGAVAAALTSAACVLTSAVDCADSSDKNNPTTAQPPEQLAERIIEQLFDVTRTESSTDDQTFDECAQEHRENASPEVTPTEEGKYLEESYSHATTSANINESGQHGDNLSELTECDRDRFIVECNEDMGQTQAKTEPTPSVPQSRSPSPKVREFRESYIEEVKPPEVSLPQLIVPTITVEDFGYVGGASPSEKGDIFYDVGDRDKIEDHLLKVPEEDDDEDDEEDEAEDEDEGDEDQWHFVHNLRQNDDTHPVDEERGANYQKTENSSDSNLSTSDSGIATSDPIAKVLHLDSCDLVNDSGKETSPHRLRDGSSTDCEENLPQCDDFDYFKDLPTILDSVEVVTDDHDPHSGILIESISLPDVVVESTSVHSVLKNLSSDSVNSDHQGVNNDSDNIDSSSSVKMGNAHFIPIRVEKRRSVDDSVLMTKSANSGYTLYNGQQYNEEKPTLEITPEEDEEAEAADCAAAAAAAATEGARQKRDLVDQESRFSTQLDDAQKNIYNLQSKVDELQSKIHDLEKDLSAKSWNVDRLQGELGAAHKEDECVRRRLKLLEDEKTSLRQKYFETEEELNNKYDNLDREYKELEEKYKQLQSFAANLQTQLACAQSEAEQCREETENVQREKDEQVRILEEALATAKVEQDAMQTKWHKEFETLRTQNADREEHLMSDCEWQLRQMQKACKDKLDKAEHLRKEAIEKGLKIEEEANEKLHEVVHLKSYEAEVKQLRGLTADQENSITSMREQIEQLKADLVTANENLEQQIEYVRKIKYQCDNAIYDKERQMLQRIDEVRNEAAAQWEKKLLTEMTRLKMELESVYVDERREELDKLQAEHIEELKALTTRYTANEEELRAELEELRESLQQRNDEFMDLREKSDNAILQTRMHLDRADRDYQTAMCREEEKREKLVESLRNEFEAEKLEMEEKFRERLGQVQDEFNKELQISTQELTDQHRKEMEQQWQKLITEKEDAIQELEVRHRKKLEDAENRLRDTETRHQHDLTDLKNLYDTEKASLDKRDLSNTQEIEQLHRKCRCLTNLFEEMRMRYERRDPRPEDLREIAELRSRCEAQERDLYELTDRLREMQIQMEELQGGSDSSNKKKSQIRKPPSKTIPTNCDVIYEENEERESPPRPMTSPDHHEEHEVANDEDDDDDDNDEEEADEDDEEENSESTPYKENTINDDDHPKTMIDIEKTKSLNLLNETIIENDIQTINDFNQIIEAEEC